MKFLLLLAGMLVLPAITRSQVPCERRTFISTVSMNEAGFTVMTYTSDLLDSLRWDFGDGTVEWQTSNVGTGAITHSYAAPGTYTVTLDQWGTEGIPASPAAYHCSYSSSIDVYDYFTDSLCGGDFRMEINGNTVSFSNQSSIHAPSFSSHPDHPLWVFGNGSEGGFINRIYDVYYPDGQYTACLYYSGFSFNDGGYMYNCETCRTFTIGGSTVGLNENSDLLLQLQPNPAADVAVLKSGQPLTDVQVFDLTGKSVQVGWTVSGDEYQLNTGMLAPGSYVLRAGNGTSASVIRFVRQ